MVETIDCVTLLFHLSLGFRCTSTFKVSVDWLIGVRVRIFVARWRTGAMCIPCCLLELKKGFRCMSGFKGIVIRFIVAKMGF
jgi:hypothetical protein